MYSKITTGWLEMLGSIDDVAMLEKWYTHLRTATPTRIDYNEHLHILVFITKRIEQLTA